MFDGHLFEINHANQLNILLLIFLTFDDSFLELLFAAFKVVLEVPCFSFGPSKLLFVWWNLLVKLLIFFFEHVNLGLVDFIECLSIRLEQLIFYFSNLFSISWLLPLQGSQVWLLGWPEFLSPSL